MASLFKNCINVLQWNFSGLNTTPVTLLGLRTCFKEDLGISIAVLVYVLSTMLNVPAEFFSSEEMPNDPQILRISA